MIRAPRTLKGGILREKGQGDVLSVWRGVSRQVHRGSSHQLIYKDAGMELPQKDRPGS